MKLSDYYSLHLIGMNLIDVSKKVLKSPEFKDNLDLIIKKGGKSDIITKTDIAIEDKVVDYILKKKIPVNFDGEEKRQRKLTDNPLGKITFDPMDGTDNYSTNVLHYCTILTIFDTPNPKTLGESVWAGIYDHVSNKFAYFNKGEVVFIKGNEILKSKKGIKSLDELSQDEYFTLFLDLGPRATSEKFKPYDKILNKSWCKNISCAGYHLMEIAMGGRDVFISPGQKPEELVAGIPLIEGVGGAVITFDGKRAGDLPYDFNTRYQIIAARTPKLAEEIRGLIDL